MTLSPTTSATVGQWIEILASKTTPKSRTFWRIVLNTMAVFLGTCLLSFLAQISIPLPFTPVPITGQTFGVALIALLWGRNRGALILLTYLAAGGLLHLPVFAKGTSGFVWGATSGYLIGMFFAAYVMGSLVDRGFARGFFRTYLVVFIGSIITFSCGLLVLSHFVPKGMLLSAGFWPFLPGDFIKSILASFIATQASKYTQRG